MRRSDIIAHLFLIAFGVALSLGAFTLGLGVPSDPGPGFLPFFAGVLIALLSLINVCRLKCLVPITDNAEVIKLAINYKRIAFVVILIFFFGIAIEKLGYLITTFILMLLLFSIYKRKHWWTAVVGSIIVTLITYVVFYKFLNVQLPEGLLGLRLW